VQHRSRIIRTSLLADLAHLATARDDRPRLLALRGQDR
jgi:hypothetical protein